MTVRVSKGLLAHAQKARGLPHRCPTLHQPRGCGVTQGMRSDITSGHIQPGNPHRRDEACLNRCHRLAVPFDEMTLSETQSRPPPQMSQ
jgi:hypothetical protein